MKLSIREKKVLYDFACPNHHNTVTRLKWLTALTVDPQAKHRMLELARKMEMEWPKAGTPVFITSSVRRWTSITVPSAACVWQRKTPTMRRICMTKLSKYEKETIINWNEAEDTASIYTFNADLKRRLAEFSRKYPQLCRLERSTTEGSVTYVMDKSRLSIRLVPPYSEERLAAAREYAKQHGFQVLRTDKESA